MTDRLLVLNAGSSSVKFRLFAFDDGLSRQAGGKVAGLGASPHFSARREDGAEQQEPLPAGSTHEDAMRHILAWLERDGPGGRLRAAGHRIVHGGERFTGPVRVDAAVRQAMAELTPLAPLHQPHNLAAIDILAALMPELPQIACFDTAFHAGHGPLQRRYALPEEWHRRGLRRYGFHGLSYEWIAHRLSQDHPALAEGRVLAAHLGNGSSVCALHGGRSLDTTMGMTALEGLPMGTRCGSIDPGIVLALLRDHGMSAAETERLLYEACGLLGLSGISNDVKTLLASADPRAAFALEFYALKAAQHMAMMAVSLGGVDALVFTGGIGENAAPVRERICEHLRCLGDLPVLVIPADEEWVIARQAAHYLKEEA